MGELEGKVAVVTGGARGQGLSHALALARAGADVAIFDIGMSIESVPYPLASPADLNLAAEQITRTGSKALAKQVDVRDYAQVEQAISDTVDSLGTIDILVVNHGIWSRGNLWELSADSWADTLDVNLTGAWHALKATAPQMMSARSGSIILIASVNGVEGQPGASHYTASKHGVLGLMRSAAQELAPYDVRVNAILPGFVDSPMTDWQGSYDMSAGKPGSNRAEHVQNARHWPAIGGLIEPDDVSEAVLWLSSGRARRVTGIELPVDGGHLILPGFNHNIN